MASDLGRCPSLCEAGALGDRRGKGLGKQSHRSIRWQKQDGRQDLEDERQQGQAEETPTQDHEERVNHGHTFTAALRFEIACPRSA